MRRALVFLRILTVALSVGAATLLLTSGLPHWHDASTSSDPTHPCRICQIQTGFSATPAASAAVHAPLVCVAVRISHPTESPRAVRLIRRSTPRAPPIPS